MQTIKVEVEVTVKKSLDRNKSTLTVVVKGTYVILIV